MASILRTQIKISVVLNFKCVIFSLINNTETGSRHIKDLNISYDDELDYLKNILLLFPENDRLVRDSPVDDSSRFGSDDEFSGSSEKRLKFMKLFEALLLMTYIILT